MRNLSLFSLLLFLAVSCGKTNRVTIQGRVLNPVTGEGIEGAKLSIVKSSGGLPAGEKTTASTFTDSDGNYSLSVKSIKAIYLQINTFGKYHPIGWYENGKYAGGNHYALKKKTMLVDFHAVPYGEIQRHIKNTNCISGSDQIKIYYDGAEIDDKIYNVGLLTTLNGCIDVTTIPLKTAMGKKYFHWEVTKNGITNSYFDTVDVSPSVVTVLDIFY